MDLETYQQSIAMMNTNLYDIQADIQRLTQQQNQIQAQHLQAQLLQAQQQQQYGSVVMNQQPQQQPYGSQHNIPTGSYRPIQQNFGSTPHLSQQQQQQQQFTSPNSFNMRPPSRDPHQQQQQQQSQPIQYINDQGQYVNQPYTNNQQIYGGRESSPNQYVNDNGGQFSRNDNQFNQNQYSNQFESNQYGSKQYLNRDPQFQQEFSNRDQYNNSQSQFFLHENQPQQQQQQQAPTPPQRRTWAQSAATNQQQPPIPLDINAWSQNSPKVDTRTWKSSPSQGFVLHQNGDFNQEPNKQEQSFQNLFQVHSSPQHSRVHKQISQMINNSGGEGGGGYRENRLPKSPPIIDDMAPQSISFIGDEDQNDQIQINSRKKSDLFTNNNRAPMPHEIDMNLAKLNISSGSRTYRIPSPTRPSLNSNSFQDPQEDANEKGFYISFDNEPPKRPKPPLRAKRSPKKERSFDSIEKKEQQISQLEMELDRERLQQQQHHHQQQHQQPIDNNSSENNLSSNYYTNNNKMHDDQPYSSYNNQSSVDRRHHNNLENNHSSSVTMDRRHLEDVTNYPQSTMNNQISHGYNDSRPRESKAILIGQELGNLDPVSLSFFAQKFAQFFQMSYSYSF